MDVQILMKFRAGFFNLFFTALKSESVWKQKNSALEKFVFSELCESDDAGERLMSKEYPHKASADYFFCWFGSSTSGVYIVESGPVYLL